MTWQLQDAKNQFSTLVKVAETDEPQVITVHGKEKAVLLSVKDYQRLMHRDESLLVFFQASPWAKVDIDISRSKDTSWKTDL
ncbi:MAG: type II toxin-antitoxin system Phd/YefM family antitoxin [Candidatus Thiodiazotropha sp. 6PLUC9]